MLEIHSLSAAYGERLVLEDVSLNVKDGEILVVIGPNGAGKSTLIRAVSGVLPCRKGSICLDGKDLSRLNPMQRARYLAVVPQARNLPAAFTVYQSVLMGRTPYLGWLGQAGSLDHAYVRMALENTQTLCMADRRVGELSGGEQQLVLLARALAQETPVMLLDEPTTHLDLEHQTGLLKLIRELAYGDRAHCLSVLMVLHDLNLASLFADRVALLVTGRLEALGTPEEVLTERNLASVYHIPVQVISHPTHNRPLVLPDGIKDRLSAKGGDL